MAKACTQTAVRDGRTRHAFIPHRPVDERLSARDLGQILKHDGIAWRALGPGRAAVRSGHGYLQRGLFA